ncbi:MAG TPA: Bax inhibitor-1/YccA family protein, partial [Desulfobacterales bacterium]|nr:Bax inhibitor-1/YccA family protein [Desulfobacterales bacterium]
MQSFPLDRSQTQTQTQVQVNAFVRSVYNWMAVGLALTGFVAYYVSTSEAILRVVFGSPMVLIILVIAQLGMVFTLASRVHKMEASTATAVFVVYSALNGVTLSSIFLVYARTSIVSVFFICGATFLACSVYGWFTRRDLTSVGNFMFMGLIGIIIASLANLFFQSSGLQAIISYIGVLV